MLAPQAGRLDRHVRRSYLRIGDRASRHRVCCSLEEALRLAVLPGEEEGRIYFFGRVSLSAIPADANRRVWMDGVQHALTAVAARAVHGSDPRADAAEAIYFNSREESLETLLRDALACQSAPEWNRPPRFSNSLLGLPAGTSYTRQIPAILERLRGSAIVAGIAPGAAAAIIFAALPAGDPAALLSVLPADTVRAWVRELEGTKSVAGDVPPISLPDALKTTLKRAAAQFGWRDPGTVWLAGQAVLCVSPSTLAAGTVVKRARSTLRQLEAEQRSDRADETAPVSRSVLGRTLVFDDEKEAERSETPAYERTEARSARGDTDVSSVDTAAAEPILPNRPPVPEEMVTEAPPPDTASAPGRVDRVPLYGDATRAAGLFFLLNVLNRLGIAGALDACPELAEAGFAVHIAQEIAMRAAVADEDPILLCLNTAQSEFNLPPEVLARLIDQPKAWPSGFVPRGSRGSDYFLRAWVVAVRRWCWRMGRLTIREIVHRKGWVWLTRTDLDVTLPLEKADIRIRRVGLDIDPGWLPWFGEYGRVVRFHYRSGEPGAKT